MDTVKPKVVYVLPLYDPAVGGHFFHLYELLERAENALDVFVIIERAAQPPDISLPNYVQRFAFPLFRFLELLILLLRERLRGRKFFYVHYSFFGGAASWLVATLTGGTAYYWNCGMPWLYRRQWLEESLFRFVLRRTTLVTGTVGIAREYERHYQLQPGRTRVLPNWINLERFEKAPTQEEARRELGISGNAKVILFLHRLSRRKGAHLIPEIAAEVTKRIGNAIFMIVGDGPERGSLKSQVESLKLSDRVRIIGEVPNREVAKYFRVADVFLMPSEEEGFPHVLLEAMALGVPYVAAGVGGVREITPPELRGFIVPSGDAKASVEKVTDLLGFESAEREQIARAERSWVAHYDISAVVPEFVRLFRGF